MKKQLVSFSVWAVFAWPCLCGSAAQAQTGSSAFDLLQRARNSLVGSGAASSKTAPINENALDLARQALAQPFDLEALRQKNPTFDDYKLHLLLPIATEFVRDSQVKASRGDYLSAMNARLDALKLCVRIEAASSVGWVISASEMEVVAMQEIYPLASHLNGATSQTVAARLDAIESLRPNYLELLEKGRTENLRAVEELLQKPDWKQLVANQSGYVWDDHWINKLSIDDLKDVTAPLVQGQLTQMWDSYLDQARHPHWNSSGLLDYSFNFKPHLASTTLLKMPDDNSQKEFYEAQTQTLLLSCALKLKVIHEETGAYPAVFATPTDPFGNGKRLIYWRIGKTYRLYSVGRDGQDDGSKTVMSRLQTQWIGDLIPPLLEPEAAFAK